MSDIVYLELELDSADRGNDYCVCAVEYEICREEEPDGSTYDVIYVLDVSLDDTDVGEEAVATEEDIGAMVETALGNEGPFDALWGAVHG